MPGYQLSVTYDGGSHVSSDHFGLNHVFEYEAIGDLPWEKFDEIVVDTGMSVIRYPSGTGAETVFDITNPNAESYMDSEGVTRTLTPMDEFLQFCRDVGAKPAIVLPVSDMLDGANYGGRDFDQTKEAALRAFIQQALAESYPNPIESIEIGNEYEGYMTSAEYGRLSGAIASILDDEISQFYIDHPELPAGSEPAIIAQTWVFSVTGSTSPDDLLVRLQNQLSQYTQAELDAIDGVVGHLYYNEGLASGEAHEHNYGNIETLVDTSVGLLEYWSTATGNDYELMISEWNVNHHSDANHGLEQAGILLKMFEAFITEGVDYLTFWSAQYHATSLANAGGNLQVAGELFASLSAHVAGDEIMQLNGLPTGLEGYAFDGTDGLDLYLVAASEAGWTGDIDLSFFGTDTRISLARILEVDPTGADGEAGGNSNLALWNEWDLSVGWTDLGLVGIPPNATVGLTFDPYEVVHLKLDTVNILDGGPGQIDFFGTEGWDRFLGNTLNNSFTGYGGGDEFFGYDGLDTVSYAQDTLGIVADLDGQNANQGLASGDTFDAIENLIGGEGQDQLFGTDAANVITGGGAKDTINGRNGDDTLLGGDGWDMLVGGKGADIVNGGDGFDTAGYYTASWRVVVDLQDGSLNQGHAQGDTLLSIENLRGSNFNDDLRGDSAANSLSGGKGNDTLNGRAGGDSLFGEAGDDFLLGGDGWDHLDGGAGSDTAAYWTAAAGILANLADSSLNWGEAQGDTYVSIENLRGSNYNDQLYGTDAANILSGGRGYDALYGRAGDDTLLGEGGNDTLSGGAGADALDGGEGYDTAAYWGATVGVIVDLLNAGENTGDAAGDTFTSIESVTGSAFADTLRGTHDTNTLSGGGGDDTLNGRQGGDTLYGGAGNDILLGGDGWDHLDGGDGTDTTAYWTAWAGVTVDLLNAANNTGDAAGDTFASIENIRGTNYNDMLYGSSEANTLSGGRGFDTLYGRHGDDQLNGEGGNDTLSGGSGADTFVFELGGGEDSVLDFGNGDDLVHIDAALLSSATLTGAEIASAYGTLAPDNSSLLLEFGGGDTLTLNFDGGVLPAGNFDWLVAI